MPRNASGNYTLPSGNPVEAGTLIEANWANTTLNDIANELTDSLSRSGEGGMLAPFRLADGLQATPGIAWLNEPSTGFYRAGSNEMWGVVGGTQLLQFTINGMASRFTGGSASTPSITKLGDLNTGIYFPGADEIAISTGGVSRFSIDAIGGVAIGGTLSVTGAITGNLTGNVTGNVSGNAGTVTNGVYTTGSYSNPAWITALAGSKVTGNISGNAANVTGTVAIANGGTGATSASTARAALGLAIGTDIPSVGGSGATGTWGISISGNAATVSNGVYTTGSYADPSWLTSVAGSKVTGNISGNAANVTGTVAVANGGTGQTSYTDGQLLIGNSTGNTLTKATLTAGSGISITNGAGSITIASTGGGGSVTSVNASGGSTGMSFSGGPITGSGTLTLAGTLDVDNGGTGQTSYTDGQLLIGNSVGNTLSKATLTAGSGISITNGNGSITIAATGGGGIGSVTSVDVSGGTTGLTTSGGPVTTSGTITLGGTLAVANGGTGATSAANARTNLGATTVGANLFTLTNPSAVTFPRFNADNTVSALDAATFRSAIGAGTGSGSVTSVGGTGSVNGITLSGTVTSSGNLTLGGTLSGVSLSTQVTGTLPVANGGTGATDAATARANLGAGTGNGTVTSVATGTGLSGGTITTTGTISLANTAVTAGSYGSASQVGTFTVDAQGRLTAAGNTAISIANTAVSGLGTMSTQNANAVAITGGSINGTTVGASTASTGAFTSLTASTINIGSAPNANVRPWAFNGFGYISGANGNGIEFYNSTTTNYSYLTLESGDRFSWNSPGGMSWTISGGEVMRINTTGLGIGTSSPGAKLHVSNGSNADSGNFTGLVIGGTDATNARTASLIKNTSSPYDLIIRSQNATVTTTGSLIFQNGSTEQMRLTDTGNLGLGITPTNNTLGTTLQDKYAVLVADGSTARFWLGSNWYYNGGDKFIANGYSSLYGQQSGSHLWWVNATNNAGGAGATNVLTQAMTLDASGQLALGTSTASSTLGRNLTINGANAGTNSGIVLQSAATERGYLYASDTQMVLGSSTSIPLLLLTGGTERMRITSAGDVGIGTSSPATKLQVGGLGAGVQSGVYVPAFFNFDGAYLQQATTGGRGAALTLCAHNNSTQSSGWRFSFDNDAASGALRFLYAGAASSYGALSFSEMMRITDAGNVGIGTSSPGYKLSVAGAFGSAVLNLVETGVRSWGVRAGGSAANTFDIADFTAGATRLVIDSSGNVGIGTSSPASKLDVNGTIRDSAGNVRAIPQSGSDKTTSYTLTTSDVGRFVGVGSGGSITIPNSTFATGDIVAIYNNTTGNITITCSTTTAYIGGYNTNKSSVTLATRGVATIMFISGTYCVIHGNVS